MRKLALLFLLAIPSWGALSVSLTVQEQLYTGAMATGIARTNEPFCQGVPIPDANAITSTSVLDWSNHTTVTAGQFRILGSWPSGHAKWIEACGILGSLSAGGTATITLTDSGSGNYGGSNLASGTSPITIATGSATFTVRTANFNGLDTVQVGATTVVSTGASQGYVIMGPSTTTNYPANVTCGTGGGQSPCTDAYLSSNDAGSTSVIEVNGPVYAVIKSTFQFKDGAGNPYMRAVARQKFYKGETYVSQRTILNNSDYTNAANFISATKGFASFELRLAPTYANGSALTYNIAADSSVNSGSCLSAVCTGSLTQGGSDSAYIYQGQSNLMHVTNDYESPAGSAIIVLPYLTADTGYAVVKNASAQTSTTSKTVFPTGWLDVADSTGQGMEIGVDRIAAYYGESLEANAGGADVRIGFRASENGAATAGPGQGITPYYMPWQEWAIFDSYVNFHTTALTGSTAQTAFLKWQYHLVAHPTWQYVNTTSALAGDGAWPLVDPTVEDNFYANLSSSMKPIFSISTSGQDWGVGLSSDYSINAPLVEAWDQGGPGNQMDFAWNHLLNLIRRGHTGEWLDGQSRMKLVMEKAFPKLYNDAWKNHTGDIDSRGFPNLFVPANSTLVYNTCNSAPCTMDFAGMEHRHFGGLVDYYYTTGDETFKDFITGVFADFYTNTWGSPGVATGLNPNRGGYINDRSVGSDMENRARLSQFLTDQGNSTDATTVLTVGENLYNIQLHPDLCVSSFPVGCSFTGTTTLNAAGVSRARGMMYGTYKNVANPESTGTIGGTNNTCTGAVMSRGASGSSATAATAGFKQGILLAGLWEFRKAAGSSWQYYGESLDLMDGISNWALTEDYNDTGTNSWADSGPRYYINMDSPNDVPHPCFVDGQKRFQGWGNETFSMNFHAQALYNGSATAWKHKFITLQQRILTDGNPSDTNQWLTAQAINDIATPPSSSLVTVPMSVGAVSGGNYPVTVPVVPYGATSYRMKCSTDSTHQLVEWIGYNPGLNTWANPNRTPALFQNWFSGTEITGLPAPGAGGTTQNFNIPASACSGTNLTTANFMLKANVAMTPGVWTKVLTHGIPVENPSNPGHMAWMPGWEKACLFGGYHNFNSEYNGAMECFDYETNNWQLYYLNALFADEHLGDPGHPDGHWPTFDSVNIMGVGQSGDGSGSSNPTQYHMTYGYDIGDQQGFPRLTAANPGRSANSTGVYNPNDKVFVMNLNGTSWYNWATNTWTQKLTSASSPPQTFGACMFYRPADHDIYMLFGTDSVSVYGTLSRYVGGSTNTWTNITSSVTGMPIARANGACDYNPNNDTVYYWGGKGCANIGNAGHCITPVTFTNGSPVIAATNSFTVGQPVVFTQGTLPTNLSFLTYYYVVAAGLSSSAFEVAATPGGTPISASGAGSGVSVGYAQYQELWALNMSTLAFSNATPTTGTLPGPIGGSADPGIAISPQMVVDPAHNVLILANSPVSSSARPYLDNQSFSAGVNQNETWIYCVSGTCAMPGSTELVATSPVESLPAVNAAGLPSLNRDPAGWAMKPTIAVWGSGRYLGVARSELNNPFGSGPALSPVPYVDVFDNVASAWSNAGHDYTAYVNGNCAAGNSALWYDAQVSFAGGALWLGYYGTQGTNRMTYMQQGNNTTIPTSWNPNCNTAPQLIANVGGSGFGAAQLTQAVDVGGTAYVAMKQPDNSGTNQTIQVAHWTGSTWSYDTPTAGIQTSSSSDLLSLQMFTDGTHPCVIWSEYVNTSNTSYTVSQVYVSCLISGTWTTQGGGAANKNTSNWASYATATNIGGQIYAAWTERTTAGTNQVLVRTISGGVWTDVGTSLNTDTTNGWSFAPSIFTDGSIPYVAWEESTYQHTKPGTEQPPVGNAIPPQWRGQGYVSKFTAGAWAKLGGAINSDPIYGSVQNVVGVFYNSQPTVAFTEVNFGAPQQVYTLAFNGTAWVPLQPTNLNVTAQALNPTTVTSTTYNQSIMGWASGGTVCTGGNPYTNWIVSTGALPTGMSLSSTTAVISGTPTASGTFTFSVNATDCATPTPATDNSGNATITVNPAPSVSTISLPGGTQGTAYSQTLAVNNGTPAYTWSKSTGTLPTGLALSSSGVISGTPSATGTFNFSIQVTDSAGVVSSAQALSITIGAVCSAPSFVTTSPLATGTAGLAYSLQFSATGDTGGNCTGCTWSMTSTPSGMSFTSSGLFSGTAPSAGTYTPNVSVSNACGSIGPSVFSWPVNSLAAPGGTVRLGVTVQTGTGVQK